MTRQINFNPEDYWKTDAGKEKAIRRRMEKWIYAEFEKHWSQATPNPQGLNLLDKDAFFNRMYLLKDTNWDAFIKQWLQAAHDTIAAIEGKKEEFFDTAHNVCMERYFDCDSDMTERQHSAYSSERVRRAYQIVICDMFFKTHWPNPEWKRQIFDYGMQTCKDFLDKYPSHVDKKKAALFKTRKRFVLDSLCKYEDHEDEASALNDLITRIVQYAMFDRRSPLNKEKDRYHLDPNNRAAPSDEAKTAVAFVNALGPAIDTVLRTLQKKYNKMRKEHGRQRNFNDATGATYDNDIRDSEDDDAVEY